MDAGGWVIDAGTRPISRVGRREVRCGNTRCLLRQGKTSVVARDKGGGLRPPPQRGGGRLRRPPPFVVPLSLATTEVLSCHNRHLVLPVHLSCGHTSRFQPVPVPAGSGSCGQNRRRGSAGSVPTRFGSGGSGSIPPLPALSGTWPRIGFVPLGAFFLKLIHEES